MENRNFHAVNGRRAPCRIKTEQDKHDNAENHSADDIEQQVDNRGSFCIFPGTRAGNQGGHTGPDILAQRNEHSGLPVYHTVERQRLQDTHRSRGALDNGGNHSAGQHRENGIPAKDGKSLCKYGRFSVWLNRIGHEGKANKQDTEAYQNLSDFFLFF